MPAVRSSQNDSGFKNKKQQPPLPRHQACLSCKSRKVRCDAVRPACGPCVKGALLHNEDPRSIICDYSGASATARRPPAPSSASGSGSVSSGNSGAAAAAQTYKNQVDELQDKVIQLEALIKGGSNNNNGGTASSTSSSNSRSPPGPPSTFSHQSGVSAELWNQPGAAFDQASTNDLLASMMPGSSAPNANTFEQFNAPSAASYNERSPFSNSSQQQAAGASYQTGPSPPSGDETDPFLDLIYPGWPSDLPPPSLTRKMLDLFFTRPHCGSYLIIRSKFETAFSFPPTSPRFPSVALIHAMLAVAYTCVPSTFNIDANTYWKQEVRDTSPAVYHGRRGKARVDIELSQCKLSWDPMQVAQCYVLLCFWGWTQAKFQEVWVYTGMATRICAPFGLNHIETYVVDQKVNGVSPTDFKTIRRVGGKCVLPTIETEEDRHERANIFWHCFMCDRLAQANTGWAASLVEDDISSLLPNGLKPKGPVDDDLFKYADSLSIDSSSFFISHPPGIVGPFQLYIKALVLLSRVIRFLQRSPWPIGPRVKAHRSNKMVFVSPADLMEGAEFKDLDSDIVAFRLSFSRDLRSLFANFENTADDHYLLIAQALAHCASMVKTLHRPFATRNPSDCAFSRCLTSARAIVTTIHLLMFSTFDVGLLHPFMLFAWSTAGRVLVHDLASQLHRQNHENAQRNKSELSMLLVAMGTMKLPLAEMMREELQTYCQQPMELLLPEKLDLPAGCTEPRMGSTTDSSPEGPILSHVSSKDSTNSQQPSNSFLSAMEEMFPGVSGQSSGNSTSTGDSPMDMFSTMDFGPSPPAPTDLGAAAPKTSAETSPLPMQADSIADSDLFASMSTPGASLANVDWGSIPLFESNTIIYG